jgi:hypothetical protein
MALRQEKRKDPPPFSGERIGFPYKKEERRYRPGDQEETRKEAPKRNE